MLLLKTITVHGILEMSLMAKYEFTYMSKNVNISTGFRLQRLAKDHELEKGPSV
jgi:hypothetical protein